MVDTASGELGQGNGELAFGGTGNLGVREGCHRVDDGGSRICVKGSVSCDLCAM